MREWRSRRSFARMDDDDDQTLVDQAKKMSFKVERM